MKAIDVTQKRHLQILELYDLGLSQRQIAAQLGIHETTVSWHINRERAIQARKAEGGGNDVSRASAYAGSLPHHRGDPADYDICGYSE